MTPGKGKEGDGDGDGEVRRTGGNNPFPGSFWRISFDY